MEKIKLTSDPTVFIVGKSPVKNDKILFTAPKTWVAIDGHARRRGNKIQWQIVDKEPHVLVIDPPKIIKQGSLQINGNNAAAEIDPNAPSGYFEYIITVDGQFVVGGSAPGIIIE